MLRQNRAMVSQWRKRVLGDDSTMDKCLDQKSKTRLFSKGEVRGSGSGRVQPVHSCKDGGRSLLALEDLGVCFAHAHARARAHIRAKAHTCVCTHTYVKAGIKVNEKDWKDS